MIQLSEISCGGTHKSWSLENSKGSGSDGLHVINQVTLKHKKLVCLRSHEWIQSLWCRLPKIYILYLENIRTSSGKKEEYWFWHHGWWYLASGHPEAWLVIIYVNMGGQERFIIITQVGMALEWTQKDKILILQQSWYEIERQTCIMG